MSEDEAAMFVVERCGRDPTGVSEDEQLSIGKALLASLKAAPMTPLQWTARTL